MRKHDDINHIEAKAISYNMVPIFLMGLSGLYFGYMAGSSAIILDGTFSMVILLTVLLAKRVSKVAAGPRTKQYPRGRYLLESIYMIFKVIVLMTILVVSIGESLVSLFEYFFMNVVPEPVDQHYANLYYFFKLSFFGIAVIIYRYFYTKSNKKSRLIKLEIKSVLIDGVITASIFTGFLILSHTPLKEISDSIVLLVVASFLLFEISHDFKHQLDRTLGRRELIDRENYYRGLFNNYFVDFEFIDVYFFYLGKACHASIVAEFYGSICVDEIIDLEHEIKKLLKPEFDDVYIYLYWDRTAEEKRILREINMRKEHQEEHMENMQEMKKI